MDLPVIDKSKKQRRGSKKGIHKIEDIGFKIPSKHFDVDSSLLTKGSEIKSGDNVVDLNTDFIYGYYDTD